MRSGISGSLTLSRPTVGFDGCVQPIEVRRARRRNRLGARFRVAPPGLLRQAEFAVQLRRGIAAHPHVKLLRFDNPFLRGRTPELKLIGAELELKGLARSRCQVHELESLELAYGAGGAAGLLVNVKLHH